MTDDLVNVRNYWGCKHEFARLAERVRQGFPLYVLQVHHPDDEFKFTVIFPTKAEAMAEMKSLRKSGVTCPISILKKEK